MIARHLDGIVSEEVAQAHLWHQQPVATRAATSWIQASLRARESCSSQDLEARPLQQRAHLYRRRQVT